MSTLARTLLAVLLAGAPAGALASDGYAVGPAPRWVDAAPVDDSVSPAAGALRGGSFFLLRDDQVRFGPVLERYRRRVLKVDSPAAVQENSELSFEVDPAHERLRVHRIEVRRQGRSIDALPTAEVRVLRREPDADEGILHGHRTVLFALRDVRAGDVLDWEYTVTGSDPVLGGHCALGFVLAHSRFVRKLRCRVLWPDGRPLQHAVRGADVVAHVARRAGETEYLWERSDVAGIEMEDRLPSWFESLPSLQLSDFGSWGEVARWESAFYRLPPGRSKALDALADRFRARATAEARVLAAIRFVQDEVRYLGIEEGEGSHRPRPPEEVLARRFGDCKDKALLLVSLLGLLGVEAHPALVSSSSRGRVAQLLPSPAGFDHVIVRVDLGGRSTWVDATESHQGGSLATLTLAPFDRALLLRDGVEDLLPVPSEKLERPTREVSERFVAPVTDGPGTLRVRTVLSGAEAERAREALAHGSPDDLARAALERYAAEDLDVEVVHPPVVTDDREANRFVVEEQYRLPDVFTDDVLSVHGWAVQRSLTRPRTTHRTMPLAVVHPVHVSHTVEVELPGPVPFEDESVNVESGAFRFAHSASRNGRVVTLRFTYRSLGDSVSPAETADHLGALRRARRGLFCDVSLRAAPAGEGPAGAAPSAFARVALTVVGALLGLAVAVLGLRRARDARRRREFAARGRPRVGESPSSALELAHELELEERLQVVRCRCGRRVGEHATARLEGRLGERRLLIVTPECPGREDAPSFYFTLPADVPSR